MQACKSGQFYYIERGSKVHVKCFSAEKLVIVLSALLKNYSLGNRSFAKENKK